MAMMTLYDVLGVSPDADPETIKQAFRRAVKAHHPDLRGGDAAASRRVKAVITANEILRNPERRAAYDRRLELRRERSRSKRRRGIIPFAFSVVVLSAVMIGAAELWLGSTIVPVGKMEGSMQPRDDAEPAIDSATSEETTAAVPLPATASSYRDSAIDWSRKGDLDRAIADLERAIELAPEDAKAYRQRGNAFGLKGDVDRALADYDRALRIDPNDAAIFHDRGLMWQRNKELDKALADLDRAVRMGFTAPRITTGQVYLDHVYLDQVYSDRGAVWFEKGRYDRALADLNQAIKVNPGLATAYLRRAGVFERKGDQERARADRDQAALLDHGPPR
jgi:curved DNA-binding protein CbpA